MKKMNKKGFTLVEIMIVVAIIGLLAAIGIPSFQKARENAIAKSMDNNARIVSSAVEQWAISEGVTLGTTVISADAIYEYVKGANDAASLTAATGPLAVGASVPTLPATLDDAADWTGKDMYVAYPAD